MNDIPSNWTLTEIGVVGEIVTGNTPSMKFPEYYGGSIPWVKPPDVNRSTIIYSAEERLTEIGAEKARVLPKDSVLVTCIGNLGNVAIAGVPLATNQQINSVIFDPTIVSSKYGYYWCKTLKPWLVANSTSTTISMVNKSNFSKAPFLLAPLPEQKRIADKLDLLFQNIDSLNERLDKIPILLKQFKERVLEQAVTGELTRGWRTKRKDLPFFEHSTKDEMREVNIPLPDNWQWQPFSKAAAIKSNLVDPNEYLNYPLIAPDNIESGKGLLVSKPLVSDIMPISAKHFFQKNCIIYSKIRPNLSKLVIVDFDGLCSADMYPIIPEIELRYMYYYMLSGIFLSYATTAGERSILPKINQKGLSIIPVSIPPISEQQEIVKRVDELFLIAEKIAQSYKAIKLNFEKLSPGILNKAFRGELVEHDESDEAANALLERIKSKNVHPKEKMLSKASSKIIVNETTHSIKSKIIHGTVNNLFMNLSKIIEKNFGNSSFTFEQLNEHLSHNSKEDYIKTKKDFFKLLRNEKLKKKESKIISEIDKSLGVVKFKLLSNETLTV